jgi:hypothetical protein
VRPSYAFGHALTRYVLEVVVVPEVELVVLPELYAEMSVLRRLRRDCGPDWDCCV